MIANLLNLIPAKHKAAIARILAIAGAAAVVALSVGGYGHIRYTVGKSACVADQAQAAVTETKKATTQRETVENETRRMPDSDINRLLREHGWMRPYADR